MRHHRFEGFYGQECRGAGRGPGGEDFEGFGGHGFGGRGGRGSRHGFGGPWRGGFGGRERLFDAGDIRIVILKLLDEQPSYGYQLIKRMEDRLAGGYTPSAGVVYPTLTMLEEEGLASVTSENNRKIYSLTEEGRKQLAENAERLEELFERLDEAGAGFRRGRSPELMKAFMDLRGAVAARMMRGKATPEQIRKIAEAIHTAAKTIDEL
jgi:DNA-binding PadR family transcriptional regulator